MLQALDVFTTIRISRRKRLMSQEVCKNCGRMIGALEDAYVFRDLPVCQPCYRRLSQAGAAGLERSYRGYAVVAGLILAVLLIVAVSSRFGRIRAWLGKSDAERMLDQTRLFAPQLKRKMELFEQILERDHMHLSRNDHVSHEIDVLSIDVDHSNSAVYPLVGVINMKFNWAISNDMLTWRQNRVVKFELSPEANGKWKCVHATMRIVSDEPVPGERTRAGQEEDWTGAMQGLLLLDANQAPGGDTGTHSRK